MTPRFISLCAFNPTASAEYSNVRSIVDRAPDLWIRIRRGSINYYFSSGFDCEYVNIFRGCAP